MTTTRLKRINSCVWLLALFASIFLLCFHEIWDRDIFFHLATGKAVLERGGLLYENIFTWTRSALPFYHNPSWLFQVGSALLYSWGGLTTIIVVKCVIVLTLFAICWRVMRNEEAASQGAVLVLFVVAMAISFRLNERPEILSFFFLAVLVWVIQRWRQSRSIPHWWLPALFAVWANAHSGFVFGLIYLYLFIVGETINRNKTQYRSGTVLRQCIPAAVFATGATFLTPEPLANYRFLFQHLHVNEVLPVAEYAKPGLADFAWFYVLLAGVAVCFALDRKNVTIADLLPICFFMFLAIWSVRFIPFFALASMPWVGQRIQLLANVGWSFGARPIVVLCQWVIPVLMVLLVIFAPPIPAKHAATVNAQMTPLAAFRFLNEIKAEGNFYNTMSYGAAGMFYLYPQYRLFQTSYIQVEEDLMGEAYRSSLDPAHWKKFLGKHEIDVALIDARHEEVSKVFFPSDEWALVYFDDYSAVFLRRGSRNDRLIDLHEYKVVSPEFFVGNTSLRVDVDLYRLQAGVDELRRALRWNPESSMLHLMMGYYLGLGAGSKSEAERHFSKVITLDPELAPAYLQLGLLLRDRQKYREAVNMLNTYIDRNPDDPVGYLELANTYRETSELSSAERILKRGIRTVDADVYLYHALANLLRDRQEFTAALDNYRQALNQAPNDPAIMNDMGVAYGMKGDLDEALNVFEQILLQYPGDRSARGNHEYTLEMLRAKERR